MGREAVRGFDRALGGVGTGVAPTDETLRSIPVVNRLVSNIGKRSQARTDFFEINESLSQVLNTFSALKGSAKADFLRENQKDIADARRFRRFSNTVFRLIKKQKTIRNATPSLSPQERRKLIDRINVQINKIAASAVALRRREAA